MKNIKLKIFGILLLLITSVFSGCIQTNDQEPVATINVGENVNLLSETMNSNGGTITISKPGDVLDGFEIVVPENAYSSPTDFTISYSPIIDHTLGEHFNPISPLIHVDNGGEYSEDFMIVTIPVKIPENHFAMAFYFDETTGELEGMPLINETKNSITIATRHFSKFTVSSVVIDLLFDDIDTGFKHGVDDWQFTNQGSYIVPNGHCSGQSVAAMYYYNELKGKRKTQLYGTYDNDGRVEHKTPKLDYDDEKAYKLCSVLQKNQDWGTNKVITLHDKQRTDDNDMWSFLAFAYTMLKTGKPQFVGVYKYYANGTVEAGHALIAYRIELSDTTLNPVIYVSDPNYPYSDDDKNERSIMFDIPSNKFENYSSPTKAGNPSFTFTHTYYFGVTSFISWEAVEWFWEDMEAGTIGEESFPEYDLEIWDNKIQEFILFDDGLSTDEEKVKLRVNFKGKHESARIQYYDESAERKHGGVFFDDLNTLEIEIDLKMGSNKIGLYIGGHETKKFGFEYIGFDWITIERTVEDLGTQGARIVVFAHFEEYAIGRNVFIEGKKVTPTGATSNRLNAPAELFYTLYAYQFSYNIHNPENYILFTAGIQGGSTSSKIVTYGDLVNASEIELNIYIS